MLNVIHESFDAIPITKNYILQLHKILYSYMNTPFAPFETPEALDRICEEYNLVIGNFEVEPLIVIPIFIHGFLCIHPFNDGKHSIGQMIIKLKCQAKLKTKKDWYFFISNFIDNFK